MFVSISIKAFLNVLLTNFMYTSTQPSFWWWYNDIIVCWMFILLQNLLNVLDIKYVLISEINVFQTPYSVKIRLVICTRSCADKLFWEFAVVVYNTKKSFTINYEIHLHQLLPKVYMVLHNLVPFLETVFGGTPKYVAHCLTMCPISAFTFLQYTDSLASSCVFSIPIWFLCHWSYICFCNEKGMTIYLPFIAAPSIIARPCLIGQYWASVCSKSSLFCGQCLIMYTCNICNSPSILIAFLVSSTDMHTGMSIAMLGVFADVHISYFLGPFFSMIVMG